MIDPGIIRAVRDEIGLTGDPAATRIVVAMSGGVDSSVVAGLLKHAGYDVVGITLQLYDHGAATGRARACCAGQDIHDARRAAAQLGIAHYVLDFESRFRQAVIDDFADSYLAGETPIPCVRCNQTVKFSDLFERARGLGAAALATGHYVRSAQRGGSCHRDLLTPADASRDQSYFLFATTQQQLDFLRFPLGVFSKAETRAMAAALGLALADKPDSQDICFVPQGRYADVIGKLRPDAAAPGAIVDLEGRVLGSHNGIVNFTVGQRRGLGVAAGEPLYVVRLDPGRRQVVVGPRTALLKDRLALKEVNWIGGSGVDRSHRVEAKIRSTHPAAAASVRIRGDRAVVMLDEPAMGVAPGQACVLYAPVEAGTRVLGGGFIEAASLTGEPGRAAAERRVFAEAALPEELCP